MSGLDYLSHFKSFNFSPGLCSGDLAFLYQSTIPDTYNYNFFHESQPLMKNAKVKPLRIFLDLWYVYGFEIELPVRCSPDKFYTTHFILFHPMLIISEKARNEDIRLAIYRRTQNFGGEKLWRIW